MKLNCYMFMFISMFCVALISGTPITSSKLKRYHPHVIFTENWFKANQLCISHGMHLAIISSKEENNQLVETIRQTGSDLDFWIAATNLGNEPNYYWFGMYKPMPFTNWKPGEPSNTQNVEHCVMISTKLGESMMWNDADCNKKSYFVCEEEISNPTSDNMIGEEISNPL